MSVLKKLEKPKLSTETTRVQGGKCEMTKTNLRV